MQLEIAGYGGFALLAMESLGGERWSQSYSYRIEFANPQGLDLQDSIGRAMVVYWAGQPIHGIVTQWQRVVADAGVNQIVHCACPLSAWSQELRSQVFTQQSVDTVIKKLLQQEGWRGDRYQWRVQQTFQPENFIQYEQSNGMFFQSLLAEYGLLWTFQGNQGLIITDERVSQSRHHLSYCQQTALVSEHPWIMRLTRQQPLLPQQVALHWFDYNDPDGQQVWRQHNQSNLPGFGLQYLDSPSPHGESIALLRQQSIDCQRDIYQGISNDPNIVLGDLITVNAHPSEYFNQSYQVIGVHYALQHHLAQNAQPNDMQGIRCLTHLTLIPKDIPFRPPLMPRNKPLFLTARIIGQADGEPCLDQRGGYSIQFDFASDESGIIEQVPLNQAYTGTNSGIHFPLSGNTCVLISFIQGQLTRPVIMGVIPNQDHPGPVTQANAQQHLLRTKAEHFILLDEGETKALTLANPALGQSLRLQSQDAQSTMALKAQQGAIEVSAPEGISVTSGGDTLIDVAAGGHWQVGTNSSFLAKQGLQFSTKKTMTFAVENNINFTTMAQDLCYQAKHILHQHEGDGQWLAEQGAIDCHAKAGNLSLSSQQLSFTTTTAKTILIKTPKASLCLTEDGTIQLQGEKIRLQAQQLTTHSQQMQQG